MKKIIYGIMVLAIIGLIFVSGCQQPITPPQSTPTSTQESEKEFCCGGFSEASAVTTYFWSDDSECGVPKEVSCIGSCPTIRDKDLCR